MIFVAGGLDGFEATRLCLDTVPWRVRERLLGGDSEHSARRTIECIKSWVRSC